MSELELRQTLNINKNNRQCTVHAETLKNSNPMDDDDQKRRKLGFPEGMFSYCGVFFVIFFSKLFVVNQEKRHANTRNMADLLSQ